MFTSYVAQKCQWGNVAHTIQGQSESDISTQSSLKVTIKALNLLASIQKVVLRMCFLILVAEVASKADFIFYHIYFGQIIFGHS